MNLVAHKEPIYLKGFSKKEKAGKQRMHSRGRDKRKQNEGWIEEEDLVEARVCRGNATYSKCWL